MTAGDASTAKQALRREVRAARRRLSLAELVTSANALRDLLLSAPEVRRAATLAAYVSVGVEPGTGPLLEALEEAGRRVLLPVLRADGDLDWATYHGPTALAPVGRGLLEPMSPRLGVDVVQTADVVLCPGLAVDRVGRRLGRGRGCYDRALGRVPVGTFVCVLLHDGEIRDRVPAEPHDRAVTAACTPAGLVRF